MHGMLNVVVVVLTYGCGHNLLGGIWLVDSLLVWLCYSHGCYCGLLCSLLLVLLAAVVVVDVPVTFDGGSMMSLT